MTVAMSSGSSTPVKTAPKAMSSRLLTMKFMQRAAASSKPLSPISSPAAPEQPSPKRRKTDGSSPVIFDVDSLADHRAIQNALADEEAKRQAALDRQAAEAGDTRWVLNFATDVTNSTVKNTATAGLRVVSAGFATIDKVSLTTSSENSTEPPVILGRRSFGKFNRAIEKLQDPDYESSESESDEDEESEVVGENGEQPDQTDALIKETQQNSVKKLKADRKAKRKSEKAELIRLAEKRKKKNVNLNDSSKLNSISSGGGSQLPDTRACHNCGEIGHIASQCSNTKRRRRENELVDRDDHPNKTRKFR